MSGGPLTLAGPSTPWITVEELTSLRPKATDLDGAILPLALQAATDWLFSLTGRQFVGNETATVRPTAQPVGWSLAKWQQYYSSLSGSNYSGSWGSCSGENDLHRLCSTPPQVDLGLYPLNSITSALIDGVTIPSNEYRIDNERWLVRTLPTAHSVPTERYGWPTCQDMRLPSSEIGTFEVTATYGMLPPVQGKVACAALAFELGKDMSGLASELPSRVTSITRQGVSTNFLSIADAVKDGLTGILAADMFVAAVNPTKRTRQPMVYSPDLGTVRRPS